jgi:hypothetical protein
MANNLIQVKRTSVSGRVPNTSILHTGELALNMADGILYSSNGTAVFEVGANNTNVNVSGNLVVNSIVANNTQGTSGQFLAANSIGGVYWASSLGYAGSQGNDGYTGSNGNDGYTGSSGIDGYTGSQGNDGYTGSQGTTGFTGSSGTDGYTGSQGTNGFTGSQGTTGFVGSQGTTGFTGSQGTNGFTGSQGSQGTTGFVGSQGTTGFVGSQGIQGNFGGETVEYYFSTANTNSDPGIGYFKFNTSSSNLATATVMYINQNDIFGVNTYNFLLTIDASTSGIKGHFRVADVANNNIYSMFAITGTHTYSTSYVSVPISYVSGQTTPYAANENMILSFAVTGDRGDTGYVGSQGANSLYTEANTAPISPTPGDRWFNTDLGVEFVYTVDMGGSQWVELAASGFLGATGYTGSQGAIGFVGSAGTTLNINAQTTPYSVSNTDNAKLISMFGNNAVTISQNVFSPGQNFVIYNANSTNSMNVIQGSGVTLFLAGTTTTGNRTLSTRGIATVICVDVNQFTIAGPGVL